VTRHLLWPTILALVGIALSFFILFRIVTNQITEEVPAEGGTYVEGLLGYWDAINPVLLAQANSVDRDLSALVFNGLTALDETGRLLPALATEWEVSPDGTVYDFELRRGVTWHDGTPFTSADVAFTVQAIQDPDFQGDASVRELWRNVTVEPQGDYAVRFTLTEPFIPFINYTTMGLLPAHLLSHVPAAELPTHEFSTRQPVGTGMFKVESIAPDRVTLVSNPDFWGQKPYLQRIELRSFGDWDTLLAAYERKDIQGIARVAPEYLAEITQPEAQLYSARSARYALIYLNLQSTSSPFFQDKAVRQALLYALDRQGLVDEILAGQGLVADSPILPGTWAYDSSLPRYGYSLETAINLLDTAGWSDTDGDRVRDKDGTRLAFTLLTSDDPLAVDLAEAIVQQWRVLGVDASTESVGDELVSDYVQPRDFEAVLIEVGLNADPDPYPWWHSTQIADGGQNFAGFTNEQADIAMEEARAITDAERRTQLYQQFQQIFAEEVPSLLLYYPIYTYAVDGQVKGVQLSPLFFSSDRFRNVIDWYVETQTVIVTAEPTLDKSPE